MIIPIVIAPVFNDPEETGSHTLFVSDHIFTRVTLIKHASVILILCNCVQSSHTQAAQVFFSYIYIYAC